LDPHPGAVAPGGDLMPWWVWALTAWGIGLLLVLIGFAVIGRMGR
jgi:hypothetical protein